MLLKRKRHCLLFGMFFIVAILGFACSTANVTEKPNVTVAIDVETPAQVGVNEISTALSTPKPLEPPQATPSQTLAPSILNNPTPTQTPPFTLEATKTVEIQATHPTGYVVFQSRRTDTDGDSMISIDDGIHLYLLNLESGETIQLTEGEQQDTHPSLAPDASKVAFASNRNNDLKQLYVMNSDGTEVTQITESPGAKTCPEWSPDGRQIVYTVTYDSESEHGQTSIELLDIEGGGVRTLVQLPHGQIDCPSWAPNGSYLAIGYKQGNQSHIAVLILETNEIIELELDEKRYDEPKFLPRNDGLFLSIIQTPGDFSSSSLVVLQFNEKLPSSRQTPLFTIEDMFGGYNWTNNGQWLISAYGFGSKESSSDVFSGYDIIVIPVDIAKLLMSENNTLSIFTFDVSGMLTENDFYDDYPNWSP